MSLYDRQSQHAHARYCAERHSRKNMSKSRGGRHRTLRVGAVVDSIHSTILLAGSRILRRMGWSKGTGNKGVRPAFTSRSGVTSAAIAGKANMLPARNAAWHGTLRLAMNA